MVLVFVSTSHHIPLNIQVFDEDKQPDEVRVPYILKVMKRSSIEEEERKFEYIMGMWVHLIM